MNDELDIVQKDTLPMIPKKATSKAGIARAKRTEITRQSMEIAAIAYVQMENGVYKYPENARCRKDEDGNKTINKRELMRRAGYSAGSLDMFDEYLGQKKPFWDLVELHRIRFTDPHFRVEQEHLLWRDVGGEAMRNLYERIFYTPHSMSTAELIKIVEMVIKAGISFQKLGKEEENKADRLMATLDPAVRERALNEYKKSLEKELKGVEALANAHSAADAEYEDQG